MSNVILNPETLSQDVTYKSDTTLAYFLSQSRYEGKQNFLIHLEEGVSLDLNMVDFSSDDLDLTLSVEMKRNSRVILSLASLNRLTYQKIFRFNVTHNEEDTYSRVMMSGINAGEGTLRFLGNSTIVNGAHRSDTRQEGKITNLSALAKSEVSPALLIKENDVNASHGAALGAYNPEEVFYLMSRGLSLQEAKKLITFGSLLPIIQKLDDEKLVEQAKKTLEELTI